MSLGAGSLARRGPAVSVLQPPNPTLLPGGQQPWTSHRQRSTEKGEGSGGGAAARGGGWGARERPSEAMAHRLTESCYPDTEAQVSEAQALLPPERGKRRESE